MAKYIAACCPQQAIDEFTPDVWHDLLGAYSLGECREAAKIVVSRQPFCAPAEIIAEVKRARAITAAAERHEALVGPVRDQRDPMKDPRPLRDTIREIVTRNWQRPAIAPAASESPPRDKPRHQQLDELEAMADQP